MKLRHEHKYLIEYDTYLNIKNRLSLAMRLDENSIDNKGYHIRSVYFDDIYDSALYEKSAGISFRKKYRIRIYNYSDTRIKLEIKKKYQEYTNKISTTIDRKEYEKIYLGKTDGLLTSGNEVKMSYYLEMNNKVLRPKVIVDYYREAYVLPYNEVRLTFDKELSASRPCLDMFNDKVISNRLSDNYSRILEVKYNNFLPSFIKNLLEPFPLTRLSVSKYVLCREELFKK